MGNASAFVIFTRATGLGIPIDRSRWRGAALATPAFCTPAATVTLQTLSMAMVVAYFLIIKRITWCHVWHTCPLGGHRDEFWDILLCNTFAIMALIIVGERVLIIAWRVVSSRDLNAPVRV